MNSFEALFGNATKVVNYVAERAARIKKWLIIGACILSIFLIYTWLTTYNLEDHKSELTYFSNAYVNHADLSTSVYKDSFKHKNDVFTVYETNGEYYLVWSRKSIWSLGRYRIEGGQLPNSSANADKSQLSELQETDSSGSIYILFGKYKQSQIELNITKFDGSTSVKKYEVHGDHTFVVYTNENDCIIDPSVE